MADAVVQVEVGKEGKGPAGMTYLAYIDLLRFLVTPWKTDDQSEF